MYFVLMALSPVHPYRISLPVVDLNIWGPPHPQPYIATKSKPMIPKDLSQDIKTRLQSINGQVSGLVRLLDKGSDPEKILVQFKAVKNALDKAHYLLLDETYRKTLAIKISETVEACPGNCGNEDRIEFIRKQFPDLELDSLTEKMKEIDTLKAKLENYKKT